jgi:hypothetical protein
MISGAAKLVKHGETDEKIRLLRVIVVFLEDRHNPTFFATEGIAEMMKNVTMSLTTKQLNYFEFLEIAGIVDIMQTKLKGVATEEELKMLTISFTRQSISLDYSEYTNLVNVITVLDVMGEKYQIVDQVK